MHEIVCRSTEGLLRTGIWTAGSRPGKAGTRSAKILRQKPEDAHVLPLKTRGKPDQKRGLTLGHITAGNQPCGQSFSLGLLKTGDSLNTCGVHTQWPLEGVYDFSVLGESR